MQSLQTPLTGLNVGMFVLKNFQDIVGLFPASCSFRKWVERVVLFWGEGVSMLPLCLLYLGLNSRVQYSRVAGTLSQSSCYYYKPHTTLSTTLYRTNTTPRVFWETDSTFYSSSFLTMQLLILLWLILRRSNGFFTDDSNHHYSNLLYTSPNHKMDGENFSRKLLMLWVLSSPPFPLCHHLALRAPSYAYNQYLPQHQKCKVKTRLSYSCGMMGGSE